MAVCIGIYGVLLVCFLWRKSLNFPEWMRTPGILRVLLLMNSIAFLLFLNENVADSNHLTRNTYGGGKKTQEYRVSVEGKLEDELIVVEIGEREYSDEELKEVFQNVMTELDQTVLGENKSRDNVEKDLNLVTTSESYPVKITWELEPADVVNADGSIEQSKLGEKGTFVKAAATISYRDKEAIYVTNFMIYPQKQTEQEECKKALETSLVQAEESTREQEIFYLPDTVDGAKVHWSKVGGASGYEVLLLGAVLCVLLVWRKNQREKEEKQKLQAQMKIDYPNILSKFTLLLETGLTLKAAWKKIVEIYEAEKKECGKRQAYEEMCITYHEMNGGVAESEAYERFGKRCGVVNYMKLGALLSQNLRKGSKGLASLLNTEAMQAFEIRKNEARRRGEEASTKLLVPMMAMLSVVMIIIIVPAFLTIQL